MSRALGLVEFKTIPKGIEAVDEMLKAAEVELVFASPICPGKYVVIVWGEVDDVGTSVKKAQQVGDIFTVDAYTIPNASEALLPAITGTTVIDKFEALGAIETISAVGAVQAGDIIAKASIVQLVEIRIARGLGGKGIVTYTGELGSVENANRAVLERMGQDGGIVSTAVIARPHQGLIGAIG